ncbi:MAG TPA: enoyl-CoA hydratase family protein [Solirubrobacterales bacterium]|nr:enoyl-CoA hydratase family protein [Solirubrobacterales bacterium]
MSPFRASAPFTEDWEHFDFKVDDGVATVTLNRPDKLNALTFQSYADLRDLIAELPHRGDVRALVIAGEGRGFCSGGDVEEIIGELQKMEAAELLEFTRMTGAVIKAMREVPIPIVAQIQGIAAGAGSVLALAADFRLLSTNAAFAFLFTKVGLAGADMGSAYLLPRIVGAGRATELLMLGDKLDAESALRYGLANSVHEPEELADAANALARRLADGPALAYGTTKSLIVRELDMDLASSIELEALTQALMMKTDDHGEFYASWKEERKPDWKGR